MTFISCIICCHTYSELVVRAVQSLRAAKMVGEIIVASSTPRNDYGADRVLHIPGGPAHKRNVAAQFAHGDYIAYFDDDIQVDEDAVYRMWQACKQDGVGMVFGKLLNMEHRDQFDEAGGFLTWTGFIWARGEGKDVGQYERTEPIFAGKSAACMIRKKVLRLVGAFDAAFEILGEESDLAWRVWLSGNSVLYVPSSITFHAFNTRFKPTNFYTHKRIYFNGCKNYITMLFANLDMGNALRVVPINFLAWAISACGMFFVGKFSASFHIFRALLFVLRHHKAILYKRHKAQSLRVVPDRVLLKTIMKSPPLSYFFARLGRYLKVGLHG